VVVTTVASVVVEAGVVGGTGPASGQKSGDGASLLAYLSSHKDFKVVSHSVIHRI